MHAQKSSLWFDLTILFFVIFFFCRCCAGVCLRLQEARERLRQQAYDSVSAARSRIKRSASESIAEAQARIAAEDAAALAEVHKVRCSWGVLGGGIESLAEANTYIILAQQMQQQLWLKYTRYA